MARDKGEIRNMIAELEKLNTSNMYLNDFFHTWKESDDEIAAVFKVAEILRGMRENNISAKVFDSGLGISIFRDNSTRASRTRCLICGFPQFRAQNSSTLESRVNLTAVSVAARVFLQRRGSFIFMLCPLSGICRCSSTPQRKRR